jgi:hypothetical protein
MRTATTLLLAVLTMPVLVHAEGGGGSAFTGVKLQGDAYTPIGGTALRISFRTRITIGDEIVASGIFDCRPHAGFPDTVCPGVPGTFTMTFGAADVIGSVSSAAAHVVFPDGSSCDFTGVTPLPVPDSIRFAAGTKSPIASFAGAYACHDANGSPTDAADFATTGGRSFAVPFCKGQPTPLCRPS